MTEIVILIDKVDSGYTLSVKTRYKTKYFCWAYSDEGIAQHARDKIYERWYECPLQKFEDYTLTFVDGPDQVAPTSMRIDEMTGCWSNTEEKRINLKEVSGK